MYITNFRMDLKILQKKLKKFKKSIDKEIKNLYNL